MSSFLTVKLGSPEGFPVIGQAFEVAPRLDLEHALDLAKPWIDKCKDEHAQCSSTGPGRLPTRVLDLGTGNGPLNACLYETTRDQVEMYVALSYCWGKSGNLTTTKGTLEDRKKGILWNSMPQTFRDTVEITRGLGIRYLWIDALCIVQDDPSDWEREAANMAEVYENAYITISVDSGYNPTQGIFADRDMALISTSDTISSTPRSRRKRTAMIGELALCDKRTGLKHVIRAREPIDHQDFILPRCYYDITYPLMTRAWTLQERILSRRIIHVTALELLWECNETLFCECGTVGRTMDYVSGTKTPKIDYGIAMKAITDENMLLCTASPASTAEPGHLKNHLPRTPRTTKEWTLLIGGYSNRQLSFESDKLPAVSALAKRYSLVDKLPRPRIYLAGLWVTDLPWLLCWRSYGRRFEKRPEVYCGPTWSWVATKTPVIWDSTIYEAESKVSIVDTMTQLQGPNLFGQVKSASITVHGCTQVAMVEFETNHHAVLGLRNRRGDKIFFVPDQNLEGPYGILSGNDGDQHLQSQSQMKTTLEASQRMASTLRKREDVICLWVLHQQENNTIYGLVLAVASEQSVQRLFAGQGGDLKNKSRTVSPSSIYERIGIITAMSRVYQPNEVSDVSWFEGGETRSVTIV